MSLILDALRKSEAERQRAQLPGLLLPLVAERRSAHPALLPAIAVLLAGVAALGWWLGQSSQPHSRAEPGVPAANAPSGYTPQPSTPMVATPQPMAAAPAPASESRRPVAAAQAATPPARAVAPESPTAAPSTSVGAIPAPSVATHPATDPAAADIIREPPLPPLDALPPAQREGLPALKLSVHHYSDVPAQRFVVVNGQRRNEGEALDARVAIQAIRRDGVALRVDGQDWLLPRP